MDHRRSGFPQEAIREEVTGGTPAAIKATRERDAINKGASILTKRRLLLWIAVCAAVIVYAVYLSLAARIR